MTSDRTGSLNDAATARDPFEAVTVAFSGHSNWPVHCKKLASFRRPHARRNYNSREVVTALNDEGQSGVTWLVRRGVVDIGDDACKSEHQVES